MEKPSSSDPGSPAPKPQKRITLKTVAEAAGLSVASVSMALRDSPNVSEKTIKRVKQIARELGYIPDPALTALAAYRRKLNAPPIQTTIALVTNWSAPDGWTKYSNPRHFIGAAREHAVDFGYNFQVLWARDAGASATRFDRILKARGIRGIILAPVEHPGDELHLDWDHYSVVEIERSLSGSRFDFVEPAQYDPIPLCWKQLRALGYKRPGLVVDEHYTLRWSHRWEAAQLQLQDQYCRTKKERIPTLVTPGTETIEPIRAWLRKHQPDCIINRSHHALDAIAAEGLRIPHDIGFLSLDVADELPGCAGIYNRWDILGRIAVESLHKRLIANQRGAVQNPVGIQVSGHWEDGPSLPPRGQRSAKSTPHFFPPVAAGKAS